MPPSKQKSSASAGTRKKYAKKAAKAHGDDSADLDNLPIPSGQKPQRGQKKLSKAQKKALPKIKQYIPPPKPPAPPIPDPLDGQGLARTLPAELVVVLRRLGKKDDVTRRKGLEELREGWTNEVLKSGGSEDDELERELKETALLSAIPVWLHSFASLLQSPFHRSTALQLHSDLLSIPSLRTAILDSLSLSLLPGSQNRDILGSWLVAALEEGRRAGGAGIKSWDSSTSLRAAAPAATDVEGESSPASDSGTIDLTQHLGDLVEYLTLSILDPSTLHDNIHPAPVSSAPAAPSPAPLAKKGQSKGSKGKSAPTPTPAPRQTAPVQPSEDEELVEERLSRYRVGGLVGLTWLVQQISSSGIVPPAELVNLIRNPGLWLALSPEPVEAADSPIGLGTAHPPIRRAAYSLLAAVVEQHSEQLAEEETLHMLSDTVLGSCWLEKEAVVWETAGLAVAKFIRKWPECWTITSNTAPRRESTHSVDEEKNESENEEADQDGEASDDDGEVQENMEATEDNAAEKKDPQSSVSPVSAHYANFLEFTSTICPTIPQLTYPLLLVFVSTLPPHLLPLTSASTTQVQNLFSHLWAPVDSRLLSTHSLPGQTSAFQTFCQAFLDVTGFLVGKAWSTEQGHETAFWIVREQLGGRAWKEGVLQLGGKAGGRRAQPGVSREFEATAFGKTLTRLASTDEKLIAELSDVLQQSLLNSSFANDSANAETSTLPRAIPIFTALKQSSDSPIIVKIADEGVAAVTQGAVDRLEQELSKPSESNTFAGLVMVLTEVLRQHPDRVSEDIRQRLAGILRENGSDVANALSSDALVSMLDALHSTSASTGQEACQTILNTLLGTQSVDPSKRFAIAQSLLNLPSSDLLQKGSLDDIATESTGIALSTGSTDAIAVAVSSLRSAQYLFQDALNEVLALVCTAIHDSTEKLLTGHDFAETSLPRAAFSIFASYATTHLSEVVASDLWLQSLISVHHVIFLLHRVPGHIASSFGKEESIVALWEKTGQLNDNEKRKILSKVHESLREGIQRVEVEVDPDILIDVALATTIGSDNAPSVAALCEALLPPTSDLLDAIAYHASQPSHPSLPILDPLVPYTTEVSPDVSLESEFDIIGRTKAARWAEATVSLLRADRALVNSQPVLLQVALAAFQLAQDTLAVPGSSRGLYATTASIVHLTDLVREVEGAMSYALSYVDEAPVAWHNATVQALKSGTVPAESDLLQKLLAALKEDIVSQGGDISARSFRDVLSRHLRQSGAGEAEGEVWLNYAMSLIDKAPQLALAIILAVKPILLDTKPFSLAQSRLANALTSVKPTAAAVTKQGLPYLRLLIASAPPADAASVFLPQQRALFVLRHVNGWLTAEEDDDDEEAEMPEEVECRIAELETAVAPIVQDLSGAHWDGIFDLVENGLDASMLDDPTTSCVLYQSLILLQQIRDLCQSNKALRAAWTAKDAHMKLVLDLFLQCRNADSTPIVMIQNLILDLLGDVPEKVMENASLAQLSDLIKLSTSSAVQSAAYRILIRVIRHQTLALVLEVEASVAEAEEGHKHRTIELPSNLIGIVEQGLNVNWHGEIEIAPTMSQLLAWLAILEHFEDASLTLRWAYLDQLNSSKLLTEGLLPMLFAMLGVSEMGAWNFPASQYAVDEFYPELLDPEEIADLTPLASYLFYRSLVTIPSAVRSYYESLKSRQLSMSMLAFVARHYSPVIIAHEFAALRQPAALVQLTEEGLNVRIASGGGQTVAAAGAGSSEAIASYVVDEQPMEIGIRLPAEFPLKAVDVRDLRRVGVPENKWRGWLMSVQQTITSRNGLILEALTVFKKNVSLHFEGVVECAICYSIISLTDRTLPTKPCRTCKNRFHASCLFKWFNSSHSSSCPLCRALF
ncbi:hypothetical protein I317_07169 [Kwoniella heveanensis CBS 569]|nr:hypothetical protein I317_07169 [Kwoniella heveanensis CBS 569]